MAGTETTYLLFCSRITPASAESLLSACAELANKGSKALYLMLSSPGGSVDAAIAAYNVLRAMPFRLATHNVGRVDSMANVLFLAGDERYACANSSFMFHGVGFKVGTSTRFDMRNLKQKMDSVEEDQRKIGAILAQRTRLDEDAIARLFQEAVTRDARYALEHGIIESIREPEISAGSPIHKLVFK